MCLTADLGSSGLSTQNSKSSYFRCPHFASSLESTIVKNIIEYIFIGKQRAAFIEKAIFNYGHRALRDFEGFMDDLNRMAHQNKWAQDPLDYYRLAR